MYLSSSIHSSTLGFNTNSVSPLNSVSVCRGKVAFCLSSGEKYRWVPLRMHGFQEIHDKPSISWAFRALSPQALLVIELRWSFRYPFTLAPFGAATPCSCSPAHFTCLQTSCLLKSLSSYSDYLSGSISSFRVSFLEIPSDISVCCIDSHALHGALAAFSEPHGRYGQFLI